MCVQKKIKIRNRALEKGEALAAQGGMAKVNDTFIKIHLGFELKG